MICEMTENIRELSFESKKFSVECNFLDGHKTKTRDLVQVSLHCIEKRLIT